jgi:hypothetical protein
MANKRLPTLNLPLRTSGGRERRVGIEIELAGVSPEQMCDAIVAQFGGVIDVVTPLESFVRETQFGDFRIELDAAYLKRLAEKHNHLIISEDPVATATMEFITKAAEQLVPWEIVTPPIPFSSVENFAPVLDQLQADGALGTRHSLHYAFGVHLNPELPSLDVELILNYLRAYVCLYDWIKHKEKIDFARRLTPYINHFEKDYIALVLNEQYVPNQNELINDYLDFNPTRNRSLDLLPLFCCINEDLVRDRVDDPRVQARPTFHYRLPNCDIDNPDWNIQTPWQHWLLVEKLAHSAGILKSFCSRYRQELDRLTHPLEDRWLRYLEGAIGS